MNKNQISCFCVIQNPLSKSFLERDKTVEECGHHYYPSVRKRERDNEETSGCKNQ